MIVSLKDLFLSEEEAKTPVATVEESSSSTSVAVVAELGLPWPNVSKGSVVSSNFPLVRLSKSLLSKISFSDLIISASFFCGGKDNDGDIGKLSSSSFFSGSTSAAFSSCSSTGGWSSQFLSHLGKVVKGV